MLTKTTSHFSILSAFLLVCAGATAAAGCTTETQVVNGSAPAAAGDPALGAPTGNGADGQAGEENGPLRAVPVSLVTHEGSARQHTVSVGTGFVGELWSASASRLVRRETTGEEIPFEAFWGDGAKFGVRSLARDPTSQRVGGILDQGQTVFLYDDAGKLRWFVNLDLPLGVILGDAAVHGEEVIVTGRADATYDIGCPQAAKGQFIAWFAKGECRQISNVITPHTKVDSVSTLYGHTLAVAPDGTVALGGWFKSSLLADGRTHQAVSYFGNAFIAVVEPSGALRWLQTTAAGAGDDIWTAAFDPSGTTVMVAGGQKTVGYIGLGVGATAVGSGRAFVVALDTQSGDAKWARRFESGSSAHIESVDNRGRALVTIGQCEDTEPDTERVSTGPDRAWGDACFGAIDAKNGNRLFMKRVGSGLRDSWISADDAGFWLTAGFDGRPDIGFGPMVTGQAFFARYEYR